MGDTLRVGLQLSLELQVIRLEGKGSRRKIKDVIPIGQASVKVLRLLGAGGNAQAYLCVLLEHTLLQGLPDGASRPPWGTRPRPDRVVLKVPHKPDSLSAEQHDKYQKAAQLVLGKEHAVLNKEKLKQCDNIIDTFGVCAASTGDGELLRGLEWLPCLMLEYADQGCVWDRVSPAAGPPQPLCARCSSEALSQLCTALRVVHKAKYMHRDIKPENLLMTKHPRHPTRFVYKLCDFGCAAPHPRADESLPNDRTQGTPAYLPPEQNWQTTSDTWQVGKCLLALRSGAQPHPGDTDEVRASGLYQHLRESEWEFLKRCLPSNSGDRLATGALESYCPAQFPHPSTV
jgi:serine/threonine protein kinase